jgi:hypothetical protein
MESDLNDLIRSRSKEMDSYVSSEIKFDIDNDTIKPANYYSDETQIVERIVKVEKVVEKVVEKDSNELLDSFKCPMCMEGVVNIIFGPCGHLSCSVCSEKINKCHMCRKPITEKKRFFI